MDDLRQLALTVTANIFETMFFLFIEPREETGSQEGKGESNGESGAAEPLPRYLKSLIQVQGEASGQIRLYLPYDLACRMAENFLGLEEEVAESQALDMVGELLNMITGNLLSTGAQRIPYKLSMPANEAVASREVEAEFSRQGMNIDFDVEGQRIRLQIQLG